MGLTALNCGITCNFHFILYHCFHIYALFHCIIYTCICSYINVCQLLSLPMSYQLLTLRCFMKVITVHGCFLLPKCLYDPDHFTSVRLLHTWDVTDGLLLALSPKNNQRTTRPPLVSNKQVRVAPPRIQKPRVQEITASCYHPL